MTHGKQTAETGQPEFVCKVLLFASAKDLAGSSSIEIRLAQGANLETLRDRLQSQVPALTSILPHCRFSIDQQYVSDASTINKDQEVACIPPVSGG